MPCSRLQSDASGRATLSRSSKLNEVGFTISGLVEFCECDLIGHGSWTPIAIRGRLRMTGAGTVPCAVATSGLPTYFMRESFWGPPSSRGCVRGYNK
jgi:hypothetical protein